MLQTTPSLAGTATAINARFARGSLPAPALVAVDTVETETAIVMQPQRIKDVAHGPRSTKYQPAAAKAGCKIASACGRCGTGESVIPTCSVQLCDVCATEPSSCAERPVCGFCRKVARIDSLDETAASAGLAKDDQIRHAVVIGQGQRHLRRRCAGKGVAKYSWDLSGFRQASEHLASKMLPNRNSRTKYRRPPSKGRTLALPCLHHA